MQIALKVLAPAVEAARAFLSKAGRVRIRVNHTQRLSVIGFEEGVQGEARGAVLNSIADRIDVTIATQHLLGVLGFAESRGADAVIELEPEAHQVLARVEGASFAFPLEDEIPAPEALTYASEAPIKGLAQALKQVLPAVSDNPARVMFRSVRFEDGRLIGTDSSRIHWASIENGPKGTITAPLAWAKVVRGFGDGAVSSDGTRVGYRGFVGEVAVDVVAPLVEGAYPDMTSYLEPQVPALVLSREALLSTLGAIVQMGRETEIKLAILSAGTEVASLGVSTKLGAVLIPIQKLTGDLRELTLGYDARLLADALVAAGGKDITLGLGGEHCTIAPAAQDDDEGSGFFAVVAARRVS